MSSSVQQEWNPEWNQKRFFQRGEVYYVDFPEEPQKGSEESKLIKGKHRAVVMMDSAFPRRTVIVIPITSLYTPDGKKKELIHTDVVLKARKYASAGPEYSRVIKRDSFVMTNQIRSVSRNYLEDKLGEILPDDMLKIELQLIRVLELENTIEALVMKKLAEILRDREEA